MLVRNVQNCEACGSPKIRRARTTSALGRFVRGVGPFQPYACGDCRHRGWRIRPKDSPQRRSAAMVLVRGYVLGSRRKLLLLAIVAAWLGWQLARYILRAG